MHISPKQHPNQKIFSQKSSFLNKISRVAASYSEHFWFSILFVLFLLMGPFSAIAAVIGLWNLTNSEFTSQMTEPATHY